MIWILGIVVIIKENLPKFWNYRVNERSLILGRKTSNSQNPDMETNRQELLNQTLRVQIAHWERIDGFSKFVFSK